MSFIDFRSWIIKMQNVIIRQIGNNSEVILDKTSRSWLNVITTEAKQK